MIAEFGSITLQNSTTSLYSTFNLESMQTCRQSCAADFSTLRTFSRVQAGLPCSKRMRESRRPDIHELVRILVLSLVWYPLKKMVKCPRASP